MFLLCSFSNRYLKGSLSQGLSGEDGSHKGSLLQSTFIHWACCSRVPYCSLWQIGNVNDISRQTGEVLWLLTPGVGNSSRSPTTVRLKTGHLSLLESSKSHTFRTKTHVFSVLLLRSVQKNQCIHRILKFECLITHLRCGVRLVYLRKIVVFTVCLQVAVEKVVVVVEEEEEEEEAVIGKNFSDFSIKTLPCPS